MKYDDEKLLSIEEYEVMAKAYSQALKDKGFIFVQIDGRDNEEIIAETFNLMIKIKSLLFQLGNFLNTGHLYSLNERHIKIFQTMYPSLVVPLNYRVRGDKTKCFLNLLSLEFSLLSKLLQLADQSAFTSQIERIIKERLALESKLFLTNPSIFIDKL